MSVSSSLCEPKEERANLDLRFSINFFNQFGLPSEKDNGGHLRRSQATKQVWSSTTRLQLLATCGFSWLKFFVWWFCPFGDPNWFSCRGSD